MVFLGISDNDWMGVMGILFKVGIGASASVSGAFFHDAYEYSDRFSCSSVRWFSFIILFAWFRIRACRKRSELDRLPESLPHSLRCFFWHYECLSVIKKHYRITVVSHSLCASVRMLRIPASPAFWMTEA